MQASQDRHAAAAVDTYSVPCLTPSLALLLCLLFPQACRCLSNLVLDHPANQAALLVCPGALPALVTLAGSGQPGLVRLALGTLTNVVGRNEAAQQAAFEAGALPVAVGLLQAAVSALREGGRDASGSSTAGVQGSKGAQGSKDTEGTKDALSATAGVQDGDENSPAACQGSPAAAVAVASEECGASSERAAAVDAAERVCLLLANLVYHSREAKLRVVEAGAVPLLVRRDVSHITWGGR